MAPAASNESTTSGFSAWLMSPGLLNQYRNGALAILLLALTQVIIFALGFVSVHLDGFSSAILGMMLLAVVIALLDWALRRFADSDVVETFYHRFLRAPTDLLNKHMSVGFTVPFIQIFRGGPANATEISLITAMFVIAGILSPILVYGVVYIMQSCLLSLNGRRHKKNVYLSEPSTQQNLSLPVLPQFPSVTSESPTTTAFLLPPPPCATPTACKRMSDQSTLVGRSSPCDATDSEADSDRRRDSTYPTPLCSPKRETSQTASVESQDSISTRLLRFLFHNIVLVLCLVSVPVSILVAALTDFTVPADTSFLLASWMTALALQAAARESATLKTMPRRRTALVVGLNPVLMTSGVMIAYIQTKHAIQDADLHVILETFQSGLTFAKYLRDHTAQAASLYPFGTTSNSTSTTLGAGDIALTILESGLVAWGLKLFEYRRALLSLTGLVVLAGCTIFAAVTVVSGPLLAWAVELGRAHSIAFACRSVTLALGTPVMVKLGGDVGVNAAMVVFNGIVFQMAMGLGIVDWGVKKTERAWKVVFVSNTQTTVDVEIGDQAYEMPATPSTMAHQHVGDNHPQRDYLTATSALSVADMYPSEQPSENAFSSMMRLNPILGGPPDSPTTPEPASPRSVDTPTDSNDPRTVATGVAVGINAAAMGTSYLYERGSRAAPYSALAMTLFGVMTVIFTSIPPLTEWLLAQLE